MFEDFYTTLMEWLQQKNYLTIINSAYHSFLNSHEKNPDNRTLWSQLLKSLIPTRYQNFISLHPHLLESFAAELTKLNQYTGQQKFSKLVEQSFLAILPDTDQSLIKGRIQDFHNQLDRWVDGSWHLKIQNDRQDVISKLQRHALFENEWVTSAFLSGCGYWYPSSYASQNAWKKFSGYSSTKNGFYDWWALLNELTGEPKEQFAMDFAFDRIFGTWSIPGLPHFCTKPSACFECPLSKNCHYYQAKIKSNTSLNLENLIRMDDIHKVETPQLISFLAGERWTESITQKRLIENFPELFQSFATEIPTGSDDERFFIFLKGLHAIAERVKSRKAIIEGVVFNKSDIIFQELRFDLAKQKQEAFYTLILDNKYRKILLRLITRGTLNQSLVHPREVFAPAIQLRAAAVILIHNHPSGDPQPSTQDVDITKRLIEVGNIVGINVLDHVIIGQETYFSFADEELM